MTIEANEAKLDEGQNCLYKLLQQHLNEIRACEDYSETRTHGNGPAVPKQEWEVGKTYKVRLEGMNKDGLFLVRSMKKKANYEDLKAALRKLDHEDLKPVDASDLNVESHQVFLCRTRQSFVRGKILKAYPSLGICSIRDIDECKSYLVKLESVFGLIPEYCKLPARVAECVLVGVNSRTFAFRPAINNVMSLIHGNMLLKIVVEERNQPALVEMTLPSGLKLAHLIIQNIHQNVSRLSLCENMDSVFTECSRIVEMQRFIMPVLRNQKYEDDALKNIEAQVHVDMELFFRKAAEVGGFVYPLTDLYGAIYGTTRRNIPYGRLGYRNWYSFLYTYNHLFQVKTFSSDHFGRIFIHIEDINGSDIDDGFTGVESFVQLKPEILLTMDLPVRSPRSARIPMKMDSRVGDVPRNPTPENQFVVHNCQTKIDRARARSTPLNVNLHRKDTEYVEKIASMIPFQPELPPLQPGHLSALYSVPGNGYYIFYPNSTDDNINLHMLAGSQPIQDADPGSIKDREEKTASQAEQIPVLEETPEEFSSQNMNLLGLNMYSEAGLEVDAVLVGMDNNGFVYFSLDDPQMEKKYSKMLQDLPEFYALEGTCEELQLPRSVIQVGVSAVAKVGDQYRRVRIYQHYTSRQSCWVVDLDSREFHLVGESDLFSLTSKATQLVPKAHPGILTGIENFLMTPILPTLLDRVELEKMEMRVRVIEPFHEHLQIPVVQIRVQGKDLSEMLLDACLEKDSLLGRKGPDWDKVKTFLKLYLLGQD